jgi:hypothetical protein
MKAFVFSLKGWRFLFLLLKKLKAFVFSLRDQRFLFLLLERLKELFFALGGWRFLSLLLKRLKVFALRKVEGFCSHFWMLKVFAHTFGCWRFLLLLFDVKSYCSYSCMFNVFIFDFRCWKFLLLFLDIEGFYFCCLYVIGPNFHYVSIHQHQNYVYKVRFFQKYLTLWFNLPDYKHNILFYLQVYKL